MFSYSEAVFNVTDEISRQQFNEKNGLVSHGLIAVSLLLALLYTFVVKREKSAMDGIPGPRPWPILGNFPQLGAKPYETLTKMSKNYGSVYRVFFGSTPIVILNGHDTMRRALVQKWNAFSARPQFTSFQYIAEGKSIAFNSPSDGWKMHRKAAISALGSLMKSDKESMEEFTVNSIVRLGNHLKEKSNNGQTPVDPINSVELTTASILFRICFGFETEEGESEKVIMKTLDKFRGLFDKVGIMDFMPWTKPFLKGAITDIASTMDIFSKNIDELIKGSECRGRNNLASIMSGYFTPERQSLVTERQLTHTTEDVIGAGTENAVNFLNWAILYMAKYPDIQAAVHVELASVVDAREGIEWSNRRQMPLAEATMWEICRHSNMSPTTLPHAASEDIVFNGYFIPKGTAFIGNLHSIMHDPEFFPNPSQFHPQRFLETNGSISHELVSRLCIFGMGKRRCLGERYAQAHMFSSFTNLLMQCTPTESPDAPLRLDGTFKVTNKPNPFKVLFLPRI